MPPSKYLCIYRPNMLASRHSRPHPTYSHPRIRPTALITQQQKPSRWLRSATPTRRVPTSGATSCQVSTNLSQSTAKKWTRRPSTLAFYSHIALWAQDPDSVSMKDRILTVVYYDPTFPTTRIDTLVPFLSSIYHFCSHDDFPLTKVIACLQELIAIPRPATPVVR